ncbi:MAG: hypothetical protein PHV05_04650, partial [Candidatus Riflebacteria bacterium]|nr:hypothetical protein [Candidatus Riflebacteria bacterium]
CCLFVKPDFCSVVLLGKPWVIRIFWSVEHFGWFLRPFGTVRALWVSACWFKPVIAMYAKVGIKFITVKLIVVTGWAQIFVDECGNRQAINKYKTLLFFFS